MPKVAEQKKNSALTDKEKKEFAVLAEIASGRSDFYSFLAGIYSDPLSKKTIDRFRDPEFLENLTKIFGKRAISPFLQFSSDKKVYMDEILQEYHDLLTVPIEGKFTTPYESVYLTGLMAQRPRVAVQELYKQAGAGFKGTDIVDLEDHISAELAFLSYLISREADEWNAGNKDGAVNMLRYQNAFYEKHLTLWVGDFCSNVKRKTQLPVYKGIANITSKFVFQDYEQVVSLLESLEDVKNGD